MLSVDDLLDILNVEMTEEFLEAALGFIKDGDPPIDPEHPDMESALETITDKINDIIDSLPITDDYDR